MQYIGCIQLNVISLLNIWHNIVSSPEPKAHGELIVYKLSQRLCVCMCVSVSTLSNMNRVRGHGFAHFLRFFLMSLKITFHFYPNVVMGTQIDKYGTEYTNFYEDRMCRHPVPVLYCIRPFDGISTL